MFVVIMSISKYKLYTAVIKCIYRYVDYVVVVDLQYYCSYLKYFGLKTCIFNFSLIIFFFFFKAQTNKKTQVYRSPHPPHPTPAQHKLPKKKKIITIIIIIRIITIIIIRIIRIITTGKRKTAIQTNTMVLTVKQVHKLPGKRKQRRKMSKIEKEKRKNLSKIRF